MLERARTFIVYVEDRPGVLDRVASLFRRRGYNIESLTVARTETPGVSRMTIVIEADDDAARRIDANLYKLVNVLGQGHHAGRACARVRAHQGGADHRRAQVCSSRDLSRTRRRRHAEALIVEITGRATRSTASWTCSPYGIVEMVRTGASQ